MRAILRLEGSPLVVRAPAERLVRTPLIPRVGGQRGPALQRRPEREI